jgi:hypothetical protein
MLRITQMPCSNSRSAYIRCAGGSSAMLICAPQRRPTSAETKSAMQAAQKTRTAVMEFTERIVILAPPLPSDVASAFACNCRGKH